jgi:Phage integrase, N-terminal SAM-like domain
LFADAEEVTGSNPVAPTNITLTSANAVALTIAVLRSGKVDQFAVWGPVQGLCTGWRAFPMLNLPVHGPLGRDPLIRSFERYLYAENRSARTVTTYLIAVRQADAFLRERGTSLEEATQADLEAFTADLLSRRMASTAATYTRSSRFSIGFEPA